MQRSKSKSGAKKNRGLEIFLWVLLGISLIGMVIALIFQCQADHFTPSSSDSLRYLDRCEAECQSKLKFPSFDRSAYKLGPLYPVLPSQPEACNPVSKDWLKNTPPEGIVNLTKEQDGQRVRCNRSCPQADFACGLDDSGISVGVM